MSRAIATVGAILLGHAAIAQQIELNRQPGVALGLAANNPLNLSRSPDAIGFAPDRDGNHVAVYPSLRTGIDASLRQLVTYQQQGYVTPRQMITRWVCGDRCTAAQTAVLPGYVHDVAAAVHAGPDDPVSFSDPATAAAFILAAQPHETGSTIAISEIAPPVTAPATAPACAAPSWDVWGQQACRDASQSIKGEPPP